MTALGFFLFVAGLVVCEWLGGPGRRTNNWDRLGLALGKLGATCILLGIGMFLWRNMP